VRSFSETSSEPESGDGDSGDKRKRKSDKAKVRLKRTNTSSTSSLPNISYEQFDDAIAKRTAERATAVPFTARPFAILPDLMKSHKLQEDQKNASRKPSTLPERQVPPLILRLSTHSLPATVRDTP